MEIYFFDWKINACLQKSNLESKVNAALEYKDEA